MGLDDSSRLPPAAMQCLDHVIGASLRTRSDPIGAAPEWSGATVGTMTAGTGSAGTSQRNSAVAAPAPASCATMKSGTSAGRIPAKVSLAERARVTTGFANEVDAVNQYAAVMYAATANGTAAARDR